MNTTFILNRLHTMLTRYGAAGILTLNSQNTRAAGGIVTINATTLNVSYVEESFSYTDTMAGFVKPGDRKVIIDAQQVSNITVDDTFQTVDGIVHEIYRIDKTNVQGVGISFRLYLRSQQT